LKKNAKAGVAGGCVAKRGKEDLEWLTGEKVVNGCNFLPPSTRKNWTKSEQEFCKGKWNGQKNGVPLARARRFL
jgi:hypothetical protein